MPTGSGGNCGTPSRTWTFGQWRTWANCKSPGAGNQFWTWVLSNVTGPFPAPKLSDRSYGDSATAALQGHDNSAAGWFGAWLETAVLGPGIAAELAGAIGVAGQKSVAATGIAANAAGNVPVLSGLAAIGDFFQRLTQANTLIRIAEVVIGVIVLALGFARATGTGNVISTAVKARMP